MVSQQRPHKPKVVGSNPTPAKVYSVMVARDSPKVFVWVQILIHLSLVRIFSRDLKFLNYQFLTIINVKTKDFKELLLTKSGKVKTALQSVGY